MRKFPDETFDLVLTSPPYDNLRDYNGYSFDFEGTAREIQRVLKDGGVCVWVVGDATVSGSETGTSFRQALFFKEIGLNLHDTMIYKKRNYKPPYPNVRRYAGVTEYMFVFSKGRPKTFNALREPKAPTSVYKRKTPFGYRKADGSLASKKDIDTTSTLKLRTNVWPYLNTHNTQEPSAFKHPAIFPIQLARDHILSWSNEGDTVLDPFLGSGTTLLACEELKRNGVGIEISKEYCKLAHTRLTTPLPKEKETSPSESTPSTV